MMSKHDKICSENSRKLLNLIINTQKSGLDVADLGMIHLVNEIDRLRKLWKASEESKKKILEEARQTERQLIETRKTVEVQKSDLADTRKHMSVVMEENRALKLDLNVYETREKQLKEAMKSGLFDSLTKEDRDQFAFLREPLMRTHSTRVQAKYPQILHETQDDGDDSEVDYDVTGDSLDEVIVLRNGREVRRSSVARNRRSSSAQPNVAPTAPAINSKRSRSRVMTATIEEEPSEGGTPPKRCRDGSSNAPEVTTTTTTTTTLTITGKDGRPGRSSVHRTVTRRSLSCGSVPSVGTPGQTTGMVGGNAAITKSTLDIRTLKRCVNAPSWTTGSSKDIAAREHTFEEVGINFVIQKCDGCQSSIFASKSLKCKDCHQSVHKMCARLLHPPCVPRQKTISTPKSVNRTQRREYRLQDFCTSAKPMIPYPIVHCVVALEKNRLNHIGLYRVPGDVRVVGKLLTELRTSKTVPNLDIQDSDVITETLKRFLRDLRDPLVPKTSRAEILSAGALYAADQAKGRLALNRVICELPQANRDTMAYLFLHWKKVIAHSEFNKMDEKPMATCLAPAVMGMPQKIDKTAAHDVANCERTMIALFSFDDIYWQRFLNNQTDVIETPRYAETNAAVFDRSILGPNLKVFQMEVDGPPPFSGVIDETNESFSNRVNSIDEDAEEHENEFVGKGQSELQKEVDEMKTAQSFSGVCLNENQVSESDVETANSRISDFSYFKTANEIGTSDMSTKVEESVSKDDEDDEWGDFGAAAPISDTIVEVSANGDDDDWGDFDQARPSKIEAIKPTFTKNDSLEDWGAFEGEEIKGANDDWQAEFASAAVGPSTSVEAESFLKLESLMDNEEFWNDGFDSENVYTPEEDEECNSECSDIIQKFNDVNLNENDASAYLWLSLRIVEDARSLKFEWKSSSLRKNHFNSLRIDPNKVERREKPIFDSSMLLPTPVSSSVPSSSNKLSPTEESKDTPSSTSNGDSPTIPVVDFDWDASGLTNPLKGAGQTSAIIDVDFLSSNGVVNSFTNPLQKDLAEFGLNSSNELQNHSKSSILDSILQKTNESRKSPYKDVQVLSLDARKLLEQLPDLEYLQSSMLMFPMGSGISNRDPSSEQRNVETESQFNHTLTEKAPVSQKAEEFVTRIFKDLVESWNEIVTIDKNMKLDELLKGYDIDKKLEGMKMMNKDELIDIMRVKLMSIQTMEQEIQLLSKHKQDLALKLKICETRIMDSQLRVFDKMDSAFKTILDDFEKREIELVEKLEEVEKKNESVSKRNEELDFTLTSAMNRIESQEEKIDALNKENDRISKHNADLETELAIVKKKNERLTDEIFVLEEKKTQLNEELIDSREQMIERTKEVQRLQTAMLQEDEKNREKARRNELELVQQMVEKYEKHFEMLECQIKGKLKRNIANNYREMLDVISDEKTHIPTPPSSSFGDPLLDLANELERNKENKKRPLSDKSSCPPSPKRNVGVQVERRSEKKVSAPVKRVLPVSSRGFRN
ncbi:unnamed protein product [Caenorhabditis bovis]|uniref:Uncharacterized protein n=1 Tax=Caenorhabditis bovis TaxID=2654633 RepID=A0A8S1EF23_9PELO|nr:unnamed protein product [Caenorhabditis bovis]